MSEDVSIVSVSGLPWHPVAFLSLFLFLTAGLKPSSALVSEVSLMTIVGLLPHLPSPVVEGCRLGERGEGVGVVALGFA